MKTVPDFHTSHPTIFTYEDGYHRHDGTTLHYVDTDPNSTHTDNVVLLFLGLPPLWSYNYLRLMHELSEHYRCIALDFPGFGISSDTTYIGPSFAYYSDIITTFIDTYIQPHNTKVILVAHGLAGPSTFDIYSKRTDIAGAIGMNTFAFPLSDYPKAQFMFRTMASSMIGRFMIRTVGLATLVPLGMKNHPYSPEEKALYQSPFKSSAVRTEQHLLMQHASRAIHHEIPFLDTVRANLITKKDPHILLLGGEDDNGYKWGYMDYFKQLVPHTELHVIPKGNHFFHEDMPQETAQYIDTWCRQLVS